MEKYREITLIDDGDRRYKVTYVDSRLGAGWEHFAAENNLRAGDALVFQLLKLFKFKVYVVRFSDFAGADKINSTQKRGSAVKRNHETLPEHIPEEIFVKVNKKSPKTSMGRPSSLSPAGHKKMPKARVHIVRSSDGTNASTQNTGSVKRRREEIIIDVSSDSDVDDKTNIASTQKTDAAKKTCKTPQSVNYCRDYVLYTNEGFLLGFNEVKSMKDFKIIINGLSVDEAVSEWVLIHYYKLCRSQKSYLHKGVMKNVTNSKQAADIISQIVNIANAVKTCKLSTPRSIYAKWIKDLDWLEESGMRVEFLRAKLRRLKTLSSESKKDDTLMSTLIEETRRELVDGEEKIAALENEFLKLKEKNEKLAAELEAQKAILDQRRIKFQEEVAAPW